MKKKELKKKLIRSLSTVSITSDKKPESKIKYVKLFPISLKNKKYFSSFENFHNNNEKILLLKKENETLRNKNNDLIEKLHKIEIMNVKLIKEMKIKKICLEKSLREFNNLKEEHENLLKIIYILNIKGIDIEEIVNESIENIQKNNNNNSLHENKNNILKILNKKFFNNNNNNNIVLNKTNSCKNLNNINKELDNPIYNYTPLNIEFKSNKILNNSHINEMNINIPKLNLNFNELENKIKKNNKEKPIVSLNSIKFSKNNKIKISIIKNKLIKKKYNNNFNDS